MARQEQDLDYVTGIRSGDKLALSRAITLIESDRADDQRLAQQLVNDLLPFTGHAQRIGITGVPGAGKSTLIECLGKRVSSFGKRVAVLTIDPTSTRSKGSILADKTRMNELVKDEHVYIRPSPAGTALGGVGSHTREALLLCEAAGYDVVIVETLGAGQADVALANMVDVFLLLILPGSGDEIQGIKRGIVEMADAIVVNKADGDNKSRAQRTQASYLNATRLFAFSHRDWKIPVMTCSALEDSGVDAVWKCIQDYFEIMKKGDRIESKRRSQRVYWFHEAFDRRLRAEIENHPDIRAERNRLESAVSEGRMSAEEAARQLHTLVSKKD